MPLDHYVSQTYLRNFISPDMKGLLHAIRKTDMQYLTPNTKSICRIQNNSTNKFLKEKRIIEDFLKTIEPKYNDALTKIENGQPTDESVYVISGLIAYITVCSPTGIRINGEPLHDIIGEVGRRMDAKGEFPPAPESLGAASYTELLDKGLIKIEIDEKFPQAIGISTVQKIQHRLGNSKWDLLLNDHSDSPFFTSDYPLPIEETEDPRVFNTIFPLTPKLAIRIRPDPKEKIPDELSDYSRFRYRNRRLRAREVRDINLRIVRCAEDLVIFTSKKDWTVSFIEKNRFFRLESVTTNIPDQKGAYIISGKRILESRKSNES